MRVESDNSKTLNIRAEYLYITNLFADAAVLYARALDTTGGTEVDRLQAKENLSECLRHIGRYTEAIAHFGEVYAAAKDCEHHELAYRSLVQQIRSLDLLQEAQESNTHANLNRQKELIEEGLCWLRDIGRENWRHMLLLHLAYVLESLDKTEDAFDVAEEAYRLRKKGFGQPGWVLSDHACQVARFACILGSYERSFQVLDEIEESKMVPVERVRVLLARVQVLRAIDPPRLTEALEAARRAARITDEIQRPRESLFAYQELAGIAIAVRSFAEAANALHEVRRIALDDESLDRPFLLREARNAFRKARNELAEENDKGARKLYQKLSEWLEEIEEALEEAFTQ